MNLTGSYRNFFQGFTWYETPAVEDRISGTDSQRFRLMFQANFGRQLELQIHYEHRVFLNSGPDFLAGFRLDRQIAPAPYRSLNLQWEIERQDHLSWRHEFDRLSGMYRTEYFHLTVGRTEFRWGTAHIWHPANVLTPFNPLQVDREFPAGIDQVALKVPAGEYMSFGALYIPTTAFDRQAFLLNWLLEKETRHISVEAGKIFSDYVVGGDVSLPVKDFRVYGEVMGTFVEDERDFFRSVGGMEYRFSWGLLLAGEYYYNGWGTAHVPDYAEKYLSERYERGEVYNPGRHYVGAIASWQLNGKLEAKAQAIWNVTDGSAALLPSLDYKLSDYSRFVGGAVLSFGDPPKEGKVLDEYGLVPNIYFVEVVVNF